MSAKRQLLVFFFSLCVLLSGCNKREQNENQTKTGAKSNAKTLVDGFTGKTALEEGRKAQDKIRGIAADRDQQLEQID